MKKFLSLNKVALPLSVYLISLAILVICRSSGLDYGAANGWLYPILPAVLMLGVVRLLKKFSIIPFILIYVFLFGELFTLFFNHTPYSVCVVNLIAETDAKESSGFLHSALTTPDFYYSLLIMLGAYAVSLIVAFALSLLDRLGKWPRRICLIIVLSLSIPSAILLWDSYSTLKLRFNDPKLSYFIEHRDDPPEYYTTLTRFLEGAAYVYSSSSSVDRIKEMLLAAEVDSCSADSPLIVLVLGESYNKHHTPLYESEYRNTTPYMCAMRDSGLLVVFEDVVAPCNHTNDVLHALFSTCTFEERDYWVDYTLFPAIFRKAGYTVTFLSNQFAIQSADVWNQYSGGMFNKRALSELQYDYHNVQVYDYDGELLDEVPDSAVLVSKNHLLIVQFLGQHVEYLCRYPGGFDIYNSGNTTSKFGGETESQRLAEYDNSIYYNDYVISKLVEKIANLDAVMIYFADHGEECYDWRNAFMRTDEDEMPVGKARNQFEVPFVVYMSPLYQQKHPELAEQIRGAATKPMLNTDASEMLFHLAGLKTPGYHPKRDILSTEYECPIRLLDDDYDYDELMKQ